MKKALISPNEQVSNIVAWELNPDTSAKHKYLPVMAVIPNAARVAQVEPDNATFPVAEPLFWDNCADDVVADQYYYDKENGDIKIIQNAPYPEVN